MVARAVLSSSAVVQAVAPFSPSCSRLDNPLWVGLKGTNSVAAKPPRYAVVGKSDHPRSGNPGDTSTGRSETTEEHSKPRDRSVSGAFWLLDNTHSKSQADTTVPGNRTAKDAPTHVPV